MNQDELCAPHRKTQANNISANGRLGTQILAMTCFHGKEFGELHIMSTVTMYKGSKLRMVCTNKEL